MNDFFKKLCPIAAVVCFALCFVGAMGVVKNAPDDLWKAVGLFFVGMSIFVLFTLFALPALGSSKNTGAPKKTYKSNYNKDSKGSEKGPKSPKTQNTKPKASEKQTGDKIKPKETIRRDNGEQINDDSGPVTLYICNLSTDTSELDLREEFGVFGLVKSVRLVADKETGVSKGYAFVEMENKVEATLAMDDINGQEIKGQEVKVSYARRKNRGRRNYKK
ncbi:MAG: RNA recognition motif domain-containing protein [Sedimentisphaeraceae bacterium JB056]